MRHAREASWSRGGLDGHIGQCLEVNAVAWPLGVFQAETYHRSVRATVAGEVTWRRVRSPNTAARKAITKAT